MLRSNKLSEADKSLMVTVVEPYARKKIAKEAGLPSGAVPVLAAIVSRSNLSLFSRPSTIYAANICNEKLARSYIRRLVAGGFIELERRRGCRYLRPTAVGLRVTISYCRVMRGRMQDFEVSY